jgi:8-oxo-dGTP pyrophosphatase MutT (NUDIX family)
MYKIFFNKNLISFINKTSEGQFCSQVFDYAEIEPILFDFLDKLRNDSKTICITCPEDDCKEFFYSKFRLIKAAGGIVRNDENDILIIKRNGIWDLPKGKVEPDEKVLDAAVREVSEECGISNIVASDLFDVTCHIYDTYGFWALKETHWFLMKANESDFVPQREEGIEEVRWASKDFINKIKGNTYPLIFDLLSKYFNK